MCTTGCLWTAEGVANNQSEYRCMQPWQGLQVSFLVIWDLWRTPKIYQSAGKKRVGLRPSLRPRSVTPHHHDRMVWIFLFPIPLPQTLEWPKTSWQDERRGEALGKAESRTTFLSSLVAGFSQQQARDRGWGEVRILNHGTGDFYYWVECCCMTWRD